MLGGKIMDKFLEVSQIKERKSENKYRQELIKIKSNENGITVSGRELHEFLEIKTE